MIGAGFILAINLCVAGVIAGAFVLLSRRSRRPEAARLMAASYALGTIYFLLEGTVAAVGVNLILYVATFSSILCAMAVFAAGLAVHYGRRPPWALLIGIVALSAIGCAAIYEIPRDSLVRQFAYQTPYFLMQALATWIVVAARPRTWLDRTLAVVLALSAMQFLMKPWLMTVSGGAGGSEAEYLWTLYAMASQTLAAIFGLATAVATLTVLVHEVLTDVTVRSETDPLSGLLNRGGFQRQAAEALEEAALRGLPISLVIADLDHFKAVNDTFGHACGDQVIVAFAGFLRSTAGGRSVAARLGGEEFAIILPGSNQIAARLFAEGARAAFSALPVPGLPVERRFTASFGVAERLPGEKIETLLSRADVALYTAKRDGRDCVRVSEPTSGVVPFRRMAG